jgi:TPR repeat protein
MLCLSRIIVTSILLISSLSIPINAQEFSVVQIYTENQLLDLIKENKHLSQVVLDDCQLVQDIEARATKVMMPAYQFLWGDMLAYGVCIKKDVKLGLFYMNEAASQGLPEALEQLGRYYHVGKFMQPDLERAIVFLREAAVLSNLKAQLRLADIYNQGHGSPLDYPELYGLLHHAVTGDKVLHQKISRSLTKLETKMPAHVIAAAKKTEIY